jgi:DNA-binding response OmpR family regulator
MDSNYIVVLDDDPLVSKLIEQSLRVRSVGFSSAIKLFESAEKYHPLAIFVDIHIGSFESGIDALPRIRGLWPDAFLAVVTADGSPEIQTLISQTEKVDEIFVKPLRPSTLQLKSLPAMQTLAEKRKELIFQIGNVSFDGTHRILIGPDGQSQLSQRATEMLKGLIEAGSLAISPAELKERCWGEREVSEESLRRGLLELRRAFKVVGGKVELQTSSTKKIGLQFS